MDYQEVLQYLLNNLPMFQKNGTVAYKANLNNISALCKHLNHPEHAFKSIHIAGTNGKGSVSHMIASVLQEKGLKTGLCTSPHLKDFRERIKINGTMIPKNYIRNFINDNIEFINKISPSFFEITIALTFKYFADEKVDIAIIETGLGGRLDSTNIIFPVLSIITNIELDHTGILGNTLEKIAAEKAGIIKPNTPVIIGQTQNSVSSIFKSKANDKNSPLIFADQNFKVFNISDDNEKGLDYYMYKVENNKTKFIIEADLGGPCQNNNITTVLQCFELLKIINSQLNVSQKQLENGLKKIIPNTGLKGRWQIINQQPLVICDTGHNKKAINMTLNHIEKLPYKKLHFVLGFANDKNIEDILMLFPENANYYFANAQMPRALNAKTLQKTAARYNLFGSSYVSAKKAYSNALHNASENDLIFIGGSTFLVAEVI